MTSHVVVTDQIVPAAPSDTDRTTQHFAWVDVRALQGAARDAVVQAAINYGLDGIVADDPELLAGLPPTIRRILTGGAQSAAAGKSRPDKKKGDADKAADPAAPFTPDLVLTEATDLRAGDTPAAGVHVVVSDAATLGHACDLVRVTPWTVLTFTDPTKIPLEIVIAAAENSGGKTVTVVNDIEDAGIVKLVLEHGSDGLLLAPRHADDVVALVNVLTPETAKMELSELTITDVAHIGMGERACIDTCSLLELDEGCLIGSFASGMFLSCSETHPLPYMPTRPFRWNAGAVHSYVMTPDNRTRYVSELRAGQPILAVRTDGSVREVRIGRVKIERRPLISITATSTGGKTINVIAQDDWHVRLLGPGGSVNNVTELKPGDVLLGYVPTEARHVGLPITEFCEER
ncbi:3-dehydroquinate synthase II family protein [Gordonia pseudamarae]|uniref:3-dehydroquinate synthase II family protein n=1 Tax=Gordonia pseudamarae TaxID=2831662 RepID=A0ABX6IJ64_9ACTN|nr:MULTISPECIES: 3-dehydroquinate synthase II family protein [Gordonia]MBD0021316.1 3-dehydroquinate synthase II family protein [Gordonia sp. (in: high G+C Gram-positive bacteria)]QHN26505.1 3-dehydroquinate synthase II family protein [Gordonia pseudamarae]QHN35399.1 3-dehydroquinate synthase II family protein [Gordonia pseudamarae]